MKPVVKQYVNAECCTLKAFHDEWEVAEDRDQTQQLADKIEELQADRETALEMCWELRQMVLHLYETPELRLSERSLGRLRYCAKRMTEMTHKIRMENYKKC